MRPYLCRKREAYSKDRVPFESLALRSTERRAGSEGGEGGSREGVSTDGSAVGV